MPDATSFVPTQDQQSLLNAGVDRGAVQTLANDTEALKQRPERVEAALAQQGFKPTPTDDPEAALAAQGFKPTPPTTAATGNQNYNGFSWLKDKIFGQDKSAQGDAALQAAGFKPDDELKSQTDAQLVANKDFSPFEYYAQHRDQINNDPATLDRLTAIHVQKTKDSGILPTPHAAWEGLKSFVPNVGKMALGLGEVVGSGLNAAVAPFVDAGAHLIGKGDFGDKFSDQAVRSGTEALSGAVADSAGLVNQAQNAARYLHITKPWAQMTPGEARNSFLAMAEKQHELQQMASGNVEALKPTTDELAAQGNPVSPENSQLATEGGPASWLAYSKAFEAAHAAGSKLAPALEKIPGVEQAKGLIQAAPAAVVGTGLKVAGAATRGVANTAEVAAKAAPFAVGAHAIATGNLKEGMETLFFGSKAKEVIEAGAKKVHQFGEGLSGVGRQVAGDEARSVGVSRAIDAGKLAAETFGKAALGYAGDTVIAKATSDDDKAAASAMPFMGVMGALGGARAGLGRVIGNEFIQKRGAEVGRVSSPAYGDNPILDAAHNAGMTAVTDPQQRNNVNFLREAGRKIGARVYQMAGPDAFAQALIDSQEARSGTPMSEAAKKLAVDAGQHQGFFTADIKDANGNDQPVVFLNNLKEGSTAGPHETAHAFQALLGDEANQKIDAAVRQEYTPEEFDQAGADYAKRLVSPDEWQASGGDWRKALQNHPGVSLEPDTYLAREIGADNFQAAFENRGADVLKPSLYRKSLAFLSRFTGDGRKALSGLDAEQSPLIMQKMADAASGLTGDPARLKAVAANDIELRKAARKDLPKGEPAPSMPKGEPNSEEGRSKAAEDAEKIATDLNPRDPAKSAILTKVADAIRTGTGVKVEYRSAPGEPAGSPSMPREDRRSVIEAFRDMPEDVRPLWEKINHPDRVEMTKSKGPQIVGWSPENYAANGYKLAKWLNTIGRTDLSPYPIDSTTGTFTTQGWRELYRDARTFVDNQQAGGTGSGQPLVLPKNAAEMNLRVPALDEAKLHPMDQARADFHNVLFNVMLPESTRSGKGVPGNIKAQDIALANEPLIGPRVSEPGRARLDKKTGQPGEFKNYPGRTIQEVNPLRAEMEAAGEKAGQSFPGLIETNQRLNLEHIADVTPTPEAPPIRGVTDTLRAGFRPRQLPEERREKFFEARSQWGLDKSVVKEPVYHATPADYERADPEATRDISKFSRFGMHFGTAEQAAELAKRFPDDSGRTARYRLKMKNPVRVSDDGARDPNIALDELMKNKVFSGDDLNQVLKWWKSGRGSGRSLADAIRRQLTNKGYDGMVYKNQIEGNGDSYVAFDKEQIVNDISHKFDEHGQAYLPKAFEGRPVAESAKDIGAMPDAEWADTVKNYQGKLGGGLTGLAWDLGASAKTPEDVAALRDAVEKLSGPIKEARDAGDMDKAYGLIGRSQAAREAYEAATGRSLDGSNGGSAVPAIRKYIDKTYNPPVPAEAVKGQAMPSDHPDAVKVGAVVRDDETGRLFKGVTHYAALDNRKQDMHDEGKKLGHRVTQGFVSNSGEFLTRQQAATRAEEHGQVPEGYFDSRPGSMGLESTMFEHYNNVFKPDMGENHPRGAFNGQARPPVRSTDDELLKIGQDYAKSRGAAFNNDSANHEVNTPLMHEVADWYQSAKDEPAKPEVAKSYNAFKKETLDQYNALTKAGYSIEPWQKEGQPYANSAEAIADLRDNKHLFYFPSEGGFGDGATGSDKPAHPLMEDSGVKLDGQPVPFNDLFRAVHDVFGHGLNGNSFGPRGEFNAWKDHAWLYSDEARPAMSAETLGQNSWVNFGSHLRDESGNVPAKGEPGFTPLANRPFAEQKATVLPANLLTRAGSEVGGQFKPKSVFNEGKTTDEHADDFIRAKGQAAPKKVKTEEESLAEWQAQHHSKPGWGGYAESTRGKSTWSPQTEGGKSLEKQGFTLTAQATGVGREHEILVEKNGKWVGSITGKETGRQVGRVTDMEVDPKYQKQGIGETLFREMMHHFQTEGFTEFEGDIHHPAAKKIISKVLGKMHSYGESEHGGEDVTADIPKGQFAPKKAKTEDEFTFPKTATPGGFKRAWILPNGKVEQIGGDWHHQWLDNHRDVVKKYGMDVPPFEGQDAEGPREEALRKGFVRVNYNSNNGLLTVEARAKDWPKQKGQVQQIAEANIGNIDRMRVSLMDDKAVTLKDSAVAPLFNYDDKEKLEHLPFISEGAEEVRTAARGPAVPITAEKDTPVFGGYGGELTFKVFDKAGGLVDTYKNYGLAEEHAQRIGGSLQMKKTFAGAALPKKDKGYEAGEYWLGKGKLHNAPDGHEQWAVDKYGGEHSGGEEDSFPQRHETYGKAEADGYLRTVIQSDAIDVSSSEKYPKWADVPRSSKQALEDAAFRKGVRVLFDGRTVIDEPNIPEGQAQPKLSEEPEAIKEAAVKYGNEIFTGATHGAASEKVRKKYGRREAIKSLFGRGFVTNEGKFLDQEAAMRRAKEYGQIPDDYASPRLESVSFYKNQFQPARFDDAGFDDSLKQVRSGAVGGHTFNPDGTVWTPPPNKKSDIVTLASVNVPEGQALPGYLGYINEDGNAVGKRTSDLSKTTHEDEFGFGPDTAPSWRYNPEKKTVYWWNKSDRWPEELEAAEDFLAKHGQEVKAHKTLDIGYRMSARNWDNAHGQALPKKTTLAEDQGLPGFDMGRSYNRRAIGEMTKDELKGHFPEAIVPHSADEKISSNVVGSPLAKQAGGREAAVKAFSDKLVDFAKGNEHLDEFKSGAKWYSEFTPMLKKEFGADAPLFAELLAATSPQTDPHQNFNYAFDAFQKFKRGDYKAKLDKFEDGLSRLNDGRLETAYKRDVPAAERPENLTPAKLMGWWIDKHDLVVRSSGDKKIGLHSHAVLQVLARRWLTQSTGLKTHNFVQNLIGTGDGATIDLWADRTMRRLGYEGAKDRWRILPENATGVTDDDFKFSQEAFAHAAERLKMKPSALQGALWFAEKKLWADKGWSRLNLGDYRTEMDSLPLRRKGWAQQEKLKGVPTGDLPIRKRGAKQVEFSME